MQPWTGAGTEEMQSCNRLCRCDDCLTGARSRYTVRNPAYRSSRSATRPQGDAAPHSCRRVDDNTFRWQTLGQTCSRGDPGSAICVQRLDDSLNSAIHTRYRSLLRSSSMHEPRDPPSEVVNFFLIHSTPKVCDTSCKVENKKPKMRALGLGPSRRLT